MKANRHLAFALLDHQTQGNDMIDCNLVYLYRITTRSSEKKILNTTMKGLQGTINGEYTIQLDCIGYLEERTCYVAYLSRWDMMLGEPALSTANTQISTSKEPMIIQLANM